MPYWRPGRVNECGQRRGHGDATLNVPSLKNSNTQTLFSFNRPSEFNLHFWHSAFNHLHLVRHIPSPLGTLSYRTSVQTARHAALGNIGCKIVISVAAAGAGKLGFVEVWRGREVSSIRQGCRRQTHSSPYRPGVSVVYGFRYICRSQVGGGTRAISSDLHKGRTLRCTGVLPLPPLCVTGVGSHSWPLLWLPRCGWAR